MKTETHAATAAGTGPDGPDLVRPYVAGLEVGGPGDTGVMAPLAAPPGPGPAAATPAAAPALAVPPPVPAAVGRCHRRSSRHCASCAHHRRRRRARVLVACGLGLAVVVAAAAALSLRDGHPQRGAAPVPGAVPAGSPQLSVPSAPATRPPASIPPTRSATHGAAAAGTAPAATTAPARPTASAPSASAAADDGTLRAGDRGPAVAELQRLLFAQGFTYVTVNGRYDAATVRGVTQLQQDRDLSGDPAGVYGPATRAALTSG